MICRHWSWSPLAARLAFVAAGRIPRRAGRHARAGLGHDRNLGHLHQPFRPGLSPPSVQLRAGPAGLPPQGDGGEKELPPGEAGELWAFGPNIVKGYWNSPGATAETFRDGWLRTGDLAMLDEEGFCTILDREADMLIRGGENIYCIEVENVLVQHPAVADAALIGLPHPLLGEVPAALVQARPGAERERGRAAGFCPRPAGGLQGAGARCRCPRRGCRAMRAAS